MHVERTNDPAVLRWVDRDPRLLDAAPGPRTLEPTTPLGRFLDDGRVSEVHVGAGELLVRVADPGTWAEMAPSVHDVVSQLSDADLEALVSAPIEPTSAPAPSVEDVQAIVDRAAGAIAAAHGGRLEVIEVGEGAATLRLHGACNGCAGAPQTLGATIGTAVARAHPGLRITVA